MKKNLVIVTWLGSGNFGTSLQSFALHEYLKDRGYNVSILSSLPSTNGFVFYIKIFLRMLGLSFLRYKWNQRKVSLRGKKFAEFNRKEYNYPVLDTLFLRNRFYKTTDVFLSGSDQIWNTYYQFNPNMFLGFVHGKRKVAYASSIGTQNIKPEYRENVKNLLQDFYRIGVREKTAVPILAELTGRNDIVQVLDPTFLLTQEQWHCVALKAKVGIDLPDSYIFCYLLGDNELYAAQLLDVKIKTGISNIIIIPAEENPDFMLDDALVYRDAGPLEFIYLLEKASFVCTDSFHATALSINIGKNFVEFMRFSDEQIESQNSRIYDLLTTFDIMDRIYSKEETTWYEQIDYNRVSILLKDKRNKSVSFLINSIEDCYGIK